MRIARGTLGVPLSGGSRNKRPLVGNTGGALPSVRVINRPGAGRANATGIRVECQKKLLERLQRELLKTRTVNLKK